MTLVDTNVLLDVVTNDPIWADWSIRQLDAAALKGPLAINDVVYAELSVRFASIEALFSGSQAVGFLHIFAQGLTCVDATLFITKRNRKAALVKAKWG